MTFEKWWVDFQETAEYKRDSFHWDDAAKAVWEAATLAERERCEQVLRRESEHSAPCWCVDGSNTEDGISSTCDCCNFIENVWGAIRKGEGV